MAISSSSPPPPPPPTIPISGSSPLSATATPAARAFFYRFSDSMKLALSQRRPWPELLDRNSLAKPESLTEATSRIRKNASYFRINYLLLLGSVLAVSLVSHPVSLALLLLLLSAWLFLYLFRTEPLVLLGRTFTDRESLALLLFVTLIVVFLTSVGSLLISALMFGLAIVCVHGAFRVPDDLFLDEQDTSTGFLSFLGSASTPAAPSVVAHV